MNIKDIKETSCPDCGCGEVVEEKINSLHCTGHHNEYRKFECGMMLHFFPNFMRTQPIEKCQKSEAWIDQKVNRTEAINRLKIYIGKMKIDADFKKLILDKFTYIHYDI